MPAVQNALYVENVAYVTLRQSVGLDESVLDAFDQKIRRPCWAFANIHASGK